MTRGRLARLIVGITLLASVLTTVASAAPAPRATLVFAFHPF